MTSKLKLYILRKIVETVPIPSNISLLELKSLIKMENGRKSTKKDGIVLSFPLKVLEDFIGIPSTNQITKIQPDDIIKNVTISKDRANRNISFEISRDVFIKEVLQSCAKPELSTTVNRSKVVVEYSSPNVAKPFHMGHLRSTIIGNFVSNIYAYTKNDVIRLNYLGDWGTQFGLIKVGLQELNHSPETIKASPIKLLYESYVHANKLAGKDPGAIIERARKEFNKLENGVTEDVNQWKQFMDYTKNELDLTYNRLGVRFDEYNYESMYAAGVINDVVSNLRVKNIINKDGDGKEVMELNSRKVTVVKSDGSTLYLTRDIAAAIDRFKKYSFDKMYYVVENGQNEHFNSLKAILHKMDLPWANRLKHVKFGRIQGMSTRRGNVVFLSDILDESKELMIQRQIKSPTTKVPVTDKETSDVLGISCVLVNDLKQRRQKDYAFNWDTVLQADGDTGIKLQYAHCRLCNLEKLSGAAVAPECHPEVLVEDEALALVKHLSKFPEVINKSEEQLEACVIVVYLFQLCNYINKAMKVLRVKDNPADLASQRLLLFNTSKQVLSTGMSILGLKPLSEM